uniref:DnaB-like helicase N-terminal domain-containing protein n=1 Tax=Hydrotalea sp. TaxID=2881279 RepID=UPI00258DC4D9
SFLIEQSILNILLTNSFLIKKVAPTLRKESFYFEPHRILYEILIELTEKEKVINLTTIINSLQDKQLLEKIGGIDRIIAIINRFENFLDLDEYIEILNEKYLRRLMIEVGKQIINWGYLTNLDLNEIIEKIEVAIKNLTQQKISDQLYSAAEIMDEIFIEMKEKGKNKQVKSFKT